VHDPKGSHYENLRPFKNVVAQFIERLCLINQATTKILGVKITKTK